MPPHTTWTVITLSLVLSLHLLADQCQCQCHLLFILDPRHIHHIQDPDGCDTLDHGHRLLNGIALYVLKGIANVAKATNLITQGHHQQGLRKENPSIVDILGTIHQAWLIWPQVLELALF